MNRTRTPGLTVVLTLLTATAVAAQRPAPPEPPTPPEAPTPPRAVVAPRAAREAAALQRIERALRMRERLDLTESQLERLETLRRDGVARQAELHRELTELGSRLRAGWSDDGARARIETLKQEMRDRNAQLRQELEAVVTEEQREALMRGRARAVRVLPAPAPPHVRPAPRPRRWRQWI